MVAGERLRLELAPMDAVGNPALAAPADWHVQLEPAPGAGPWPHDAGETPLEATHVALQAQNA